MEENGRNIGTPNGMVLCVDKNSDGIVEGFLYHGYHKEGFPVKGYEQIIRIAERLFNALEFPFMGTGDRDIYGRTHSRQKKGKDGKSFGRRKIIRETWRYGNLCHSGSTQAAQQLARESHISGRK